ncbi:hypothetical protein Pan153_33110 [Gimesia panareensis]|uniref:DUF1559 domain-containing protein n=1 Tax=Gimesia panareensis TaxID=2527978 RepID=A0A518FQM0_9PLAN|nr:DUF1559 domain-containing protein [Gimesia panareensis]QDV18651.1 hypothetical protein Pan153_33110 [Gimesia panareensis]
MSAHRFLLLCSAGLLLCLCSACQQQPQDHVDQNGAPLQTQTEAETTQTSATEHTPEPAVETTDLVSPESAKPEPKTIDPKMVITPGEKMAAERFLLVRNQLRKIGFAFHYLVDEHQYFLPTPEAHPEFYDENGRLKVSWRVHLLPFLEQKKLYEQFKLDEAWDSPHNAPLAKSMPAIYRSPDTPFDSNKTRFRVFEGKWGKNREGDPASSTAFPLGKPLRIRDFIDGTSNSILVVETGPDKAVVWTRPGGLNLDKFDEELGTTAKGIPVLTADGDSVCIRRGIGAPQWKQLICPNDQTRISWMGFRIFHSTLPPAQLELLRRLSANSIALRSYLQQHESKLPPAKTELVNGKPLLSWRVHFLPFIGEKILYNQFHLDEPWDSPHNKQFLDYMPVAYQLDPEVKEGKTQLVTFTGKNTPFPGGPGIRFFDIPDGTSNTILLIKAAPDQAVPWTKPVDLPFDPADPWKPLGTFADDKTEAIMADGSIQNIPTSLSAKELGNLIQINDGQITPNLKPFSLLPE